MTDSRAAQILDAACDQLRTISGVHANQVVPKRRFNAQIPVDMFPFFEVYHGGETRVSEPGHLRAFLAVQIKITFANIQQQDDYYVENFLKTVEDKLADNPTLGLNNFVHQSYVQNISPDEAQDDTRQERVMTLVVDYSFTFGES